MFVGKSVRQLDDKGRIAVPAEYVDLLREQGDVVYVTPGAQGCIWVLPGSFFVQMLDRLPDTDDDEMREHFLHYSQRRRLDKSGRLLIDEDAREFAGLPAPTREDRPTVVVCGTGPYLQVWAEEAYRERVKGPRQFARDLRKLARATERLGPGSGR